MTESTQDRLDGLIERFDCAMLVTRSLEGRPRARPMAVIGHESGGRLAFASRAEDEKLDEIEACPDVAVTMHDADHFVSITGTARLERNPARARELWSPAMKLWFPDGPDDPALVVILVEPDFGEYWDRAGLRKVAFLWEAGKALIRGEMPELDDPKAHAKVRLGSGAGNAVR